MHFSATGDKVKSGAINAAHRSIIVTYWRADHNESTAASVVSSEYAPSRQSNGYHLWRRSPIHGGTNVLTNVPHKSVVVCYRETMKRWRSIPSCRHLPGLASLRQQAFSPQYCHCRHHPLPGGGNWTLPNFPARLYARVRASGYNCGVVTFRKKGIFHDSVVAKRRDLSDLSAQL